MNISTPQDLVFERLGKLLILGIAIAAILAGFQAIAANITSSVVVGNTAPVTSAVSLNAGSAITLTANATTAINVNATITDNNGCSDISNGTTSIMVYRSSITSSTCFSTQDNQNCYKATAFTVTSTCSTNTINTTTTFHIYYFAQPTDASSSFSAQNWLATVRFTDQSGSTSSADSSGVELNTLTAINVTTSSINYGTLSPNTDTGSTNQVTTSTNAGNATTTVRLNANPTLTSGGNTIATSSQHYATSSFTYGGSEQALSGTATTVSGFSLLAPTSTTNVSGAIFWGLAVPNGTATGTYSGTNEFTALFVP